MARTAHVLVLRWTYVYVVAFDIVDVVRWCQFGQVICVILVYLLLLVIAHAIVLLALLVIHVVHLILWLTSLRLEGVACWHILMWVSRKLIHVFRTAFIWGIIGIWRVLGCVRLSVHQIIVDSICFRSNDILAMAARTKPSLIQPCTVPWLDLGRSCTSSQTKWVLILAICQQPTTNAANEIFAIDPRLSYDWAVTRHTLHHLLHLLHINSWYTRWSRLPSDDSYPSCSLQIESIQVVAYKRLQVDVVKHRHAHLAVGEGRAPRSIDKIIHTFLLGGFSKDSAVIGILILIDCFKSTLWHWLPIELLLLYSTHLR